MVPVVTVLAPLLEEGLSLVNKLVAKREKASAINTFIDRAEVVKRLFAVDDAGKPSEDALEAYRDLFTDIQVICAQQGITPSAPYKGAPCINLPIANLVELMDAASKP